MTDQPNPTMPQPNTDASNSTQDSYVDNYQPPQVPGMPAADVQTPVAPAGVQPTPVPAQVTPLAVEPDPAVIETPVTPVAPAVPSFDPASTTEMPETPEVPVAAPVATDGPVDPEEVITQAFDEPQTSVVSQALEDQNVFHLLGVEDAPEDEKETFLDELQQVIWEDFLENDVELLITEEEMASLKQIMDRTDLEELQKQEEIVVYLETLVPDLEEVMLEKALELKADMMRERITGMKEYYAALPEVVSKINKAEAMVDEQKWREAAELLNTIT